MGGKGGDWRGVGGDGAGFFGEGEGGGGYGEVGWQELGGLLWDGGRRATDREYFYGSGDRGGGGGVTSSEAWESWNHEAEWKCGCIDGLRGKGSEGCGGVGELFGRGGLCLFIRTGFSPRVCRGSGGEEDFIGARKENCVPSFGAAGESGET
jgi:hypothetical protein